MSSYKPIDNKRDQFRRYVENNGIFEMLSKVLIQLMTNPEKPENPIDFIRENVGASLKEMAHIELLQQEVNSYRQQVEDLTKQLEEARRLNNTSAAVTDTPALAAIEEPVVEAVAAVASTPTAAAPEVQLDEKLPEVKPTEKVAEVEIAQVSPSVETVVTVDSIASAGSSATPVDSDVSAESIIAPVTQEPPKVAAGEAVKEEPTAEPAAEPAAETDSKTEAVASTTSTN